MNQSGYQDLLNNSEVSADTIVVGILNLPNLNANSVAIIDSSNNLSDILLNDGQLVIGKTGLTPVAASLTGTANEVIVTNGVGSITLSTPQAIATTSSPTFSNITITNNVSGPVNTRTADNILSCSTAQTTGDLLSFSAAQRVVVDSGLLSTNIVTNTGIATTNHLASFVSNKVIQDSGISSSDVFLRTGTVPMTGTMNLGNQNIIGLGNVTTKASNNNVLIGSGTTITPPPAANIQNVAIGFNNTSTGFGIVEIGDSLTQTVGAGSCVLLGSGSSVAGNQSSSYGDNNSITGNLSVAIGSVNTITGNNAYIIGRNATNNTSDSLLIGGTAITNIRPNNNNLCDLGAITTNTFKDVYASGSLIGAVKTSAVDSIVTGPASATGDNLASYNLTTGKIIKDSGISTTSVTGGPFLPLAGGTMVGGINMNSNTITNVSSIAPDATNILIGTGATTSSLRDVVIGNTNALGASSNDTISIGSSMTISSSKESVIIGNNASCAGDNCVCIGKSSTIGTNSTNICIGSSASIGTGDTNVVIGDTASVTSSGLHNVIIGASATASTNSNVAIGWSTSITGTGVLSLGTANSTAANKAHMIGTGLTNLTANTLLIDADTNIRPNSNGTTNLGAVTTNAFNNIYANGSLVGATNTRTVDNVVSNAGSSTSSNLASFSGTSGKVITDASILSTDVVTNTGGTVTANQIPVFSGTGGRLITNSTATIASGVISAVNFIASAASWCEGYTTNGVSTAFTAATPKLLTVSNFTVPASSNFSVTGQVIKYTGTPTRNFLVTYHITSTQQASAYTLNYGISANGSTTLSNLRTQTTGVASGNLIDIMTSVSQIIGLATNDTIQPMGQCSATLTIVHPVMHCVITEV